MWQQNFMEESKSRVCLAYTTSHVICASAYLVTLSMSRVYYIGKYHIAAVIMHPAELFLKFQLIFGLAKFMRKCMDWTVVTGSHGTDRQTGMNTARLTSMQLVFLVMNITISHQNCNFPQQERGPQMTCG